MSKLAWRPLCLALPLVLAACSTPPSSEETGETGTGDGDGDGDPTGDGDGDPATGDGDGDPTTGDGDGDGDASAICEQLGLPIAELQDTSGGGFGDIAGDFTVETTFGTWNLAENFSGCDSYIFVNHLGVDGPSDALRSSFDVAVFERAPQNVHWFFLNNDADPEAGAQQWQTKVGQALGPLDDETTEFWVERVHFVTEAPGSIVGSVGQFFAQNPNTRVAGIDRFQRWDFLNSTSDVGGGQFVQSAPVMAYTPRWYNFRHAQDRSLAAQEADMTEVVLMDQVDFPSDGPAGPDGPFANNFNHQVWTATFPDAQTMAGFDTMEMVLTAECGPDLNEDCGDWDYEAWVNWCDNDACDGERREVFRWITPYARLGVRRWVFNTTPMLALVREGGDHHFQFGMRWNMNPSTWDMRFRLRNTGQGGAAAELIPAFVGNKTFNDAYNDWAPVEFTPSASATKVELVALISGHGQDEGNCAEWCNHQHEFTINGADVHMREFPGEVTNLRCAEAVDEGVVPGQWGNWTPGRAGWCPGLPVQPWIVDITDQVTLDAVNTIEYRGLFGGQPVTGNRGRILLSSYIVVYE